MESNLDAVWRECKRSLYRIRLQDKSAEVRRVALMKMGRAVEKEKAARIKSQIDAFNNDNKLRVALTELKVWRAITALSWFLLAIGGAAYVIL